MKKSPPLKGIRIIDLSHSWAGPHCARLLGDFGAEVIKVEYVKRLCLLRGACKQAAVYNAHPGWLQVNRNKYSITLDLKVEKDRDILRDLIKVSDVLIENSRFGVMEKLGFGYTDAVKIKKDLIMLSMAAFGKTGPYASYSGYGAVFESVGGIQSLTAYEKNGKPVRIKELDVTNGLAGASAVMTALVHRQKTGEGQYIDLSQLEAATHGLIGEHLLEFAMNGTSMLPLGNRHRTFAPQGCYRSLGDDKWITLTIRTDEEWRSFCDVTSHPEWKSDARFATREARTRNHDLLDVMIEEWTGRHTHLQAMQILQGMGIPSGAVLDAEEIRNSVHLKERAYFMNEEDSGMLFMGMPFTLSGSEGRISRRGPELGRDNEYVICELLGRSKKEVRPMQEDQIGTAYDPE
ncbi:MAG: CoA transferase [Nitrospirae bacterium]|nr:CoA transferase [Nitrospirota bacterium]